MAQMPLTGSMKLVNSWAVLPSAVYRPAEVVLKVGLSEMEIFHMAL